MNKSQFKKYFQSIAGHKDKYGDGAEYVTMFFIFLCNCLCSSSFFFSMFDKNGDGSVDFSEFVLSCGMFSKGDIDSELDLAFTL
jgi:Ca2+-binding EF-hand superfamily protein